jgi:CBS domain-containing protein
MEQRTEEQMIDRVRSGSTLVAKDVMTTDVTTVSPNDSVREIAKVLIDRGISGAPVVVGGQVIGIVTAGDLVRRHEIGTDRSASPSRWWQKLIGRGAGAGDYVKSRATRAADVMRRNVVTVVEETPLAVIVELFERHGIRRLPVVRNGELAGIVSRSDVVRAFATSVVHETVVAAADDIVLERLLAELTRQLWWHGNSSATVSRGVVHFWGIIESDDERVAARVAAENLPGVRGVRDHRVHASALPIGA